MSYGSQHRPDVALGFLDETRSYLKYHGVPNVSTQFEYDYANSIYNLIVNWWIWRPLRVEEIEEGEYAPGSEYFLKQKIGSRVGISSELIEGQSNEVILQRLIPGLQSVVEKWQEVRPMHIKLLSRGKIWGYVGEDATLVCYAG